MGDTFELVRLEEFFKTSITGSIDIERSTSILKQIIELEKSFPGSAILIDARKTTRVLDYRDFLNLADIVAGSGMDHNQRIALIAHYNDINHTKFFESGLADRGFQRFKVFDSFESAIEWLNPSLHDPDLRDL